MKRSLIISLFLWMLHGSLSAAPKEGLYELRSPDGQTRMEVKVDASHQLVYRIWYGGAETVKWSPLGLHFTNGAVIGEHVQVMHTRSGEHRETFHWSLGDNSTIVNNYNQLTLDGRSEGLPFRLTARVFNGSVAFRYQLQKVPGGSAVIDREKTAFRFNRAYTLYQYNQESVFTPVKPDSLRGSCDFPATLASPQLYISINEADNRDYTKAVLRRGDVPRSLGIAFVRDSVRVADGFSTPWRTISFSETVTGLGRYADLLLKLCPPPPGGIPSWIRPGKLIRSVRLTTAAGMECVDFAAKHHFQYVLFDAGWYGKEFNSVSDPTTFIDALYIPAVIRYGKTKNIGIILYVNYVGLRKYLDTILPLYKKWGVAGMKFGFVNGLTQEGISWLTAAVAKAAAAGFIIDVHDNYKPTGLSRTYPALLTQEGIRGNENGPDAFHNTVLPFTRFLSGAADYTFCYPGSDTAFNRYLAERKLHVSKAQQLALTVIDFSPLQSMLWYGVPSYYGNETDIEFFERVPTVWDRSLYLKGAIGRYASIARRHGENWFVGSISGPEAWKDAIPLDFLDPGVTYEAAVYEDDGKGHIRKKILHVRKGNLIQVRLNAGAGQAVMLSPASGNGYTHK